MQAMAAMGLRAVRSAAREVARAFDRPDLLEIVGDGTYTNAERAAEADIRNSLEHTYPDHGIGQESGAEHTWWIKAIDGSANFARSLPHFALVVVCLHNGRPQHAIIVDPMRNEEFVASRGAGCRMNGTRLLRVSGRGSLTDAMVGLRSFRPGLTAALDDAQSDIRRTGSAALDLAYVAAGRLDAVVLAGANTAAVAAGSLLVAEAGGLVSDFEGGSADPASGSAVAGSRGVFRELLPLARKSYG